MEEVIVLFDDSWHDIEFNDEFISFDLRYGFEYNAFVKKILTDKQMHEYVTDCTNREFKIALSKINKAIEWRNSDKNPWGKK